MGLRLRDDFEVRRDNANSRTILENLNTGETFILNDDGTTDIDAETLQGNQPEDLGNTKSELQAIATEWGQF